MTNQLFQVVFLCAGRGSRLDPDGSKGPKALFLLLNRALIVWVSKAFEAVHGVAKPFIVVIGYQGEKIRERFGGRYTYVLQEELSGTATAVCSCLPYLNDNPVIICNGDQPLITPKSCAAIMKCYSRTKAALVLGVSKASFKGWEATFTRFGRVFRDPDGKVMRIIEYLEASREQRKITEVYAGILCVDTVWLRHALEKISKNPVTGEFHLTELVRIAFEEGKRVETVLLPPGEAFGINTVTDAQRGALLLSARGTERRS